MTMENSTHTININTLESGFVTSPMAEDTAVNDMFLLRQEIPSSGFNRLFKASRDGKWYILKGLKPEVADQTVYQQILLKEYDIMRSVHHPNVAGCDGIVEVPGLGKCLVIEYIQGQSLRQWIDQSKDMPSNQRFAIAVRIATQLAETMKNLHDCLIIHRDLKPENILITDNGHSVKVIDFGLSDTDSYAILKQPAGTLAYLAPEMLQEKPICDVRADIFSYGRILQDIFSEIKTRRSRLYLDIARRCTLPLQQRLQYDEDILKLLSQAAAYKPFWRKSYFLLIIVALICLGSVFLHRSEHLVLPGTNIPMSEIDSITDGWQSSDKSEFINALQRFEKDRKDKLPAMIKETMEQRDAFVLAFTPDSIMRLSNVDYSTEYAHSFCHRLTLEMPMLGGKFSRYSSTVFKENTSSLLRDIIKALSAYESGHNFILDESQLSDIFYHRLLSVYYPDRHLPIIDQQQVNYITQTMIPDPERRRLLRPEGSRDNRDILVALHDIYPSLNQWSLVEYAWFLLYYYPSIESH